MKSRVERVRVVWRVRVHTSNMNRDASLGFRDASSVHAAPHIVVK